MAFQEDFCYVFFNPKVFLLKSLFFFELKMNGMGFRSG